MVRLTFVNGGILLEEGRGVASPGQPLQPGISDGRQVEPKPKQIR